MTTTQWHNIPERVKRQKTNPTYVRGKAKIWCMQNGIDIVGKSSRDSGNGGVSRGRGRGSKGVVVGDRGGVKEIGVGGSVDSLKRGGLRVAKDVWGEFRDAVDSGRWHFVCHVVECIGFDRGFYTKLRDGGDDKGEKEGVEVNGEPQDI
jgi:hypothetical protein